MKFGFFRIKKTLNGLFCSEIKIIEWNNGIHICIFEISQIMFDHRIAEERFSG